MGYSKNLDRIERVRPLLDQMLKAKTSLTWPSANAHMLGYHIREALTLAKKTKFKPYDELKDKFIIRNKGNCVVADLRNMEISIETVMSKVTLEDLVSLLEIIGGAINHRADEMFFPSADLEAEEVEKLFVWAEKNNYYLIVAETGVTLTRNDPGEAKWTP